MARWSAVGIVPSGWLANEAVITGKTEAQLLIQQFRKAFLAFNLYPDPTYHYMPGIPLLQFGPAIVFALGVFVGVFRPRRQMNLLLLAWYMLIVVMGGMLLENPPSSARLLLLIPPVIWLSSIGLVTLLDYLACLIQQPRWMSTLAAICLALVMFYSSIRFYYVKYTPSHTYGGANTEVADNIGRYLRAFGAGYSAYFFGSPRMYYNFATIPYLAQNVSGVDAPEDQNADLTWVTGSGAPVFIFLPERLPEIEKVMRQYPNGTVRQYKNDRGVPLFYAYEVDVP